MFNSFEKIIIVTGYYGTGKTNLSLNIAIDMSKKNKNISVVDLDIVNLYFRISDFKNILQKEGIGLVAPNYAGSSLDIPSLTGVLNAKINTGEHLVIDVGGDDVGATALGRYEDSIKKSNYTMIYVDNFFRYKEGHIDETLETISNIEKKSRLKIDYIVNNPNLGNETTAKDVESSLLSVQKASVLANKPLVFTSARRDIAEQVSGIKEIYPIDIYVKTPWG